MGNDLKPCPFCGDAPDHGEWEVPGRGLVKYVTCRNGCSFFPTPNEWNCRATPPGVAKVVEEMEKMAAFANMEGTAEDKHWCNNARRWLRLLRGETEQP